MKLQYQNDQLKKDTLGRVTKLEKQVAELRRSEKLEKQEKSLTTRVINRLIETFKRMVTAAMSVYDIGTLLCPPTMNYVPKTEANQEKRAGKRLRNKE